MISLDRTAPGIGCWFRQDILNTLAGIEAAHAGLANRLPPNDPAAAYYRAGWEAAMTALAASFGLRYTPERPR